MLLKTSTITLLASTLLISSTTAAPTRTHCRCTIVTSPAAAYTPSTAHWTPTESASDDICSTLGPELENFSHNEADLYTSYLARTEGPSSLSDASSRDQRPLSKSVLVNWSKEPRPTSRPNSRIVCRAERDAFSAYQGSITTLWILQMIVAVAILACIAEGVHLCVQWYGGAYEGAVMRLPGSQFVLEINGAGKGGFEVRDAEKQDLTNQQGTPRLIVQAPNGDRVCITYEEEYDDDEVNRPVM